MPSPSKSSVRATTRRSPPKRLGRVTHQLAKSAPSQSRRGAKKAPGVSASLLRRIIATGKAAAPTHATTARKTPPPATAPAAGLTALGARFFRGLAIASGLQLAVGQRQHAAAPRGRLGIVRDHHQEGVLLAHQLEEQVQNPFAGRGIQVAGRLVGQD